MAASGGGSRRREVVVNVCLDTCRTSPSPLGEKVAEGRMRGASVDHRLGEAPHPTLSPADGRGTVVVVTTPVAVEVVLNVCCNACRTSPSPLGEKVAEGRMRGLQLAPLPGKAPHPGPLPGEERERRRCQAMT